MNTMSSEALNIDLIKTRLRSAGLTQKDLATQVDVTAQAVTNWLKGKDFPRPPALLRMATMLEVSVDDLVSRDDPAKPVIAFRKKGSSKTTQAHIEKAEHVGWLLRPLVEFLPAQNQIRPVFRSNEYSEHVVAAAAVEVRQQLVGEKEVVKYGDLIHEFSRCGAVVVPVLWGKQEKHKNALHIHLPQEDVTFIFLNLDTRVEDFKFWMAHELAHVYTPHLSGSDEGEDFAELFAGALLFPAEMAAAAYEEIKGLRTQTSKLDYLKEVASELEISLYTVYSRVQAYVKKNKLPALNISETSVHKLRNFYVTENMGEKLFKTTSPSAKKYVKVARKKFKSSFFDALRRMIAERDVGSGYLQQILNITPSEAIGIHQVLVNDGTGCS